METKQRIYLDENNKLVVETDNATIDGYNHTSTALNGEFIIQANDVAKLLSMINEANIKHKQNLYILGGDEYWVQNDSQVEKAIQDKIRLMESRLDVETEISKHLHEKIEEFNKTRRWYERKLDVNK
jgi:hypothetical protein